MAKMKKFFLYFLMFIALYIFVTTLTNFSMKEKFKDIQNIQISVSSPKIFIEESKATNSHGYIKGNITNDTGNHIPVEYLQVDLYNENNTYLGSEFKELKYFNVNETINFEINYKYNNVNRLVIGVTDEIIQDKEKKENYVSNIKVEPVITEETIKIAVPISAVLMLNTALGVLETL
mgnify:CR=1 FL=1